MKKYRIVAILGLVFFLLVCSKTKNPVDNDPSGFLFESFQSECGSGYMVDAGGSTNGDSVIFNVYGDTIVVLHYKALYQCCALIKIDVVQSENGFDIFESDTGEQCNCLCYFDITTLISGLAQGSYFIRLFDIDGEPVDSALIDIPPKYTKFESSQSACNWGLYKSNEMSSSYTLEDSVLFWFSVDTLWVMHKNANENCCSKIVTEVKRTLEGFDIFELDIVGPLCGCTCYFDILTTIHGVSPGVYMIRVFDIRDTLVGQVEVEIQPVP